MRPDASGNASAKVPLRFIIFRGTLFFVVAGDVRSIMPKKNGGKAMIKNKGNEPKWYFACACEPFAEAPYATVTCTPGAINGFMASRIGPESRRRFIWRCRFCRGGVGASATWLPGTRVVHEQLDDARRRAEETSRVTQINAAAMARQQQNVDRIRRHNKETEERRHIERQAQARASLAKFMAEQRQREGSRGYGTL